MAQPAAAPPTQHSWRWLGLLIAVTIAIGAVAAVIRPLQDVDIFWHVRVGSELLRGVSIYDVGRDWSYAPVPDHWVSTQWIIEIVFAWLHGLLGWSGLVLWGAVTTAATLGTLMWTVFPRSTNAVSSRIRVWAALVAYGLGVWSVLLFSQERPQQVSFILLPLVGYWWLRAVREGHAPRWWALLILTIIWANSHGLWIMLPTAFALAVLARLLDHGRRDPAIKGLLVAVGATVLGGCVTPIGPLNLLTPIRFVGTTSEIQEWRPTSFVSGSTAGLTMAVIAILIAWALGRARPSRGEVLYVLLLFIFGAAAGRNVTPATLMLAPLVAWRLSMAFRGPKQIEIAPGLQAVARPAFWTITGIGFFLVGYMVSLAVPIPVDAKPVALVAQISALPGDQRILNGYDISGFVLWFDRPEVSSGVDRVGIDGRADRYGAAYLTQYLDMERGRPGWDATVAELQPTVALLPEKDALASLLELMGWRVIGHEAKYVLLMPPAGGPRV